VIKLTPTSYIVLGLVEAAGEATPYDLKRMVAASLGNFWSLNHAQLYTEPERLAKAGYLSEHREEGGRRRKRYAITTSGRAAVREWLRTPSEEFTELRDRGLLQLFFGADKRALAEAQLGIHEPKLAEYEQLHRDAGDAMPEGVRLTLESGIGHEREWVRFWRKVRRSA
jgi:PadR family transcriptional regulator, regulatory protein AphA